MLQSSFLKNRIISSIYRKTCFWNATYRTRNKKNKVAQQKMPDILLKPWLKNKFVPYATFLIEKSKTIEKNFCIHISISLSLHDKISVKNLFEVAEH